MIYGLYLSAAGVMTNAHRQDTIANNLANVETGGFKRSLTLFEERPPLGGVSPDRPGGDPRLDAIGGGLFVSPTAIDHAQGPLEATGNPLDAALLGRGFFAVKSDADEAPRLTRNGVFAIDAAGRLVTADDAARPVLSPDGRPVLLGGFAASDLSIGPDGSVTTPDGMIVARIGTYDVTPGVGLVPIGSNAFAASDPHGVRPCSTVMRGGFVERSNVDPATEMTRLIDAHRALEANATLIRLQDQTLGRLVNDAARVA